MDLRPGLSFRLAPLFHSRVPWTARLRVNGGIESKDPAFVPRDDWRSPTPAELTLLVAEPNETPLLPSQAGVLVLPEHIRSAWWKVAERSKHLDGHLDGFDRFVADVLEFLRFKRLPLPSRCRCDVVASRPEQRSTRAGTAGGAAGIGFGLTDGLNGMMRALGAINLGDEATHVVLLNLLLPDLAAARGHGHARAPAEKLADWFTRMPHYPLVRVRLEPGEGLWLPAAGVAYDGSTMGKQDLDVVLTIWSEGGDG